MAVDLSGAAEGVPERFAPEAISGQLVEAEHLGRYWWISALAGARRVLDAGCGVAYGSQILYDAGAHEVTGVDLSPEIIEAARERVSRGIHLHQADLRRLPFGDDSFDLVVCFGVIEHVIDPDPVVRELARVLAPGGVLAISTPNPDVCLQRNPHHHKELTADELTEALGRALPHIRLVRQQRWLTSGIVEDEAFAAASGALADVETRTFWGCSPGDEVATLALASDVRLPWLRSTAVISHATDVRKLVEHVQAQQRLITEQSRALKTAGPPDLGGRVAALERAMQGRGEVEALRERIGELEAELERERAVTRSVLGSRSWRYLEPARAAAARARGRVRGSA